VRPFIATLWGVTALPTGGFGVKSGLPALVVVLPVRISADHNGGDDDRRDRVDKQAAHPTTAASAACAGPDKGSVDLAAGNALLPRGAPACRREAAVRRRPSTRSVG
jgi:hypothetical protein